MIIGNRYFIDDAESGLYEVSKDEYERYCLYMQRIWKEILPKLSKEIHGKPIVFGTTGHLEKGEDFKIIFCNPNNKEDDNRNIG